MFVWNKKNAVSCAWYIIGKWWLITLVSMTTVSIYNQMLKLTTSSIQSLTNNFIAYYEKSQSIITVIIIIRLRGKIMVLTYNHENSHLLLPS